jgi:Tfp pilus assembly protein PilN
MLRINLSTRPFYNIRAVHAVLALGAAIVLLFTLVNTVQIVRLALSQQTLGASAADAEREALRLRAEAAKIRSQINPQELEVVAAEAREANRIIDQRAFSWTELFAQFEATLPPDVRITAVQPRAETTNFVVAIGVQARRAEDLDAFVEALETGGTFHDVLAVKEQTTDTGLIEAIVEANYVPPARQPASAADAASDAGATTSTSPAAPGGGR